jgi:hypothetical protein
MISKFNKLIEVLNRLYLLIAETGFNYRSEVISNNIKLIFMPNMYDCLIEVNNEIIGYGNSLLYSTIILNEYIDEDIEDNLISEINKIIEEQILNDI